MPRFHLAVAAGLLLAALGLPSVVSSGASPASKYKLLYSFQGSPDGAYPMSGLTLDSAGNFYGTTRQGGTGAGCNSGCGTVFELERTQNGWKEKILYSFRAGDDGYFPQAGVIFDSSGNLYGTTTSGGGTNYNGTVFELTRDLRGLWAEKIIYRFNFRFVPTLPSDLILDVQGNLYGTTRYGGKGICVEENECGTVFEITPQSDGSWTYATLYTFDDPPDGGNPSSALVFDSAGNLYGTTEVGGTGTCYPRNQYDKHILNCGTVFKLTHSTSTSWTESILYNFQPFGGRAKYPSGGVLFDKTGDIFGTSLAGGNGDGAVFELRQQQDGSWSQTQPHLFYGKPDGDEGGEGFGRSEDEKTLASLVMDGQGDLFVVTYQGGANEGGTVLELQPRKNGWKPKIVHAFTSAHQGTKSGLVLGLQGHLYGTTLGGGLGTIYEIVP